MGRERSTVYHRINRICESADKIEVYPVTGRVGESQTNPIFFFFLRVIEDDTTINERLWGLSMP